MKRSKAERKLREYLQAAPFTMWGDFEIAKPDRLEDAVQWCMKHLLAAGLVHDKEPQGDSTGVVMTPLGPIYPKPAQCDCPLGIDGNGAVMDEHCPIHGRPADLDKSRMDSGLVIYKEAQTCTCEFVRRNAGSAAYTVLDPDCPIHGPHAFPWRKSR
jgi:hypothetical protein